MFVDTKVYSYCDKQLLRFERQCKNLKEQQKAQPTILLDEPYQSGWKRLFVLKAEVAQSDRAAFFQQILNVINEEQHHYDASFKQPKRKGRWHRYHFDRLPQLQNIESYNWRTSKDKLTDEQREYFEAVKYWDDSRYDWSCYYRFTMPELFEIAVLPRMVYELRIPDGDLESQVAYVYNKLYEPPALYRHIKITGGSNKNCYSRPEFEKKKYEHPFKNKPMHEIIYRNFFDI